MKKIVYMSGGSPKVVHPAPDMFDPNSPTRLLLASKGVTFSSDEEVLAWIIQKDVPNGAEACVVDEKDIPENRALRARLRVRLGKLERA